MNNEKKKVCVGIDVNNDNQAYVIVDIESGEILNTHMTHKNVFVEKIEEKKIHTATRKLIKRKKARVLEFKKFSRKHGMNCKIDTTKDFHKLRCDALDFKSTKHDLYHILYNMIKHRGYITSAFDYGTEKDDETGKILSNISENKKIINNNYRTVGEMLYKDEKFSYRKRNKGDYHASFSNPMIIDEARKIFAVQRQLGNDFIDEKFEEEFLSILISKRSGVNYKNTLKNSNRCPIYPDQYGAGSNQYQAALFIVRSQLANLSYVDDDGVVCSLSSDDIQEIIDVLHIKPKLTLVAVFRVLGIRPKFYDKNQHNDFKLNGYHELRDALGKEYFDNNYKRNIALLNHLVFVMTKTNDMNERYIKFKKMGISDEDISKLKYVNFSGTVKFSLHACAKIYNKMKEGYRENEAIKILFPDYFYAEDASITNNILDNIKNPVVKSAFMSTVNTISRINKIYDIKYINIEHSKDLNRSYEENKKIDRMMSARNKENEALIEKYRTYNPNLIPSRSNIKKLKLYEEQNGVCPYSGNKIPIEDVVYDRGSIDIDHIYPQSKRNDDTLDNLVLTFRNYNLEKSNLLPSEWLQSKPNWRNEILIRLKELYKDNPNKLNKFLADSLDTFDFTHRMVNDNRYIVKEFSSYVKKYMGIPVNTIPSRITGILRGKFKLGKKDRSAGWTHHVIDAAILAGLNYNTLLEFNHDCKYVGQEKMLRDGYSFNINNRLNFIWSHYSECIKSIYEKEYSTSNKFELDNESITVWCHTRKKRNGQAHRSTIVKVRNNKVIKRISLKNATLDDIENMVDKERHTDLYNSIKARIEEYEFQNGVVLSDLKGNKFKQHMSAAFNEFVHNRNLVRKISCYSIEKAPVKVKKGYAGTATILSIKIYDVDGKRRAVPIYPHNKNSKAYIKIHHDMDEWPTLPENSQCIAEIYNGCSIKFSHGGIVHNGIMCGFDRSSCQVTVSSLGPGHKIKKRTPLNNLIL